MHVYNYIICNVLTSLTYVFLFYKKSVLQDAKTNANIKVLAALIQDCYFALVRLIDPPIKTLLVAMSLGIGVVCMYDAWV